MIRILIHTDTRYPVNRRVIRKAVSETIDKNAVGDLDAEVSVAVVGERKMKDLSQKYFDGQGHEVMSFSQEDASSSFGFVGVPNNVLQLGDVILCWPRVLEAAARDDIFVDEEVANLVSHGVEHLLGKHHEE